MITITKSTSYKFSDNNITYQFIGNLDTLDTFNFNLSSTPLSLSGIDLLLG